MLRVLRSASLFVLAAVCGCKSAPPAPAGTHAAATAAAVQYPVRPSVAAPEFKVFHHDASSVTLVTKDDASDAEIEAIIWQLRDAAHAHTFDRLGVPQSVVDARDPLIWFHIYRGAKCASEKYTSGPLPCGASYHAAGEFTFGGFTNKEHDDGVLRADDGKGGENDVHLWNADAPYAAH